MGQMCGASHGDAFDARCDGGQSAELGLAWSSARMQGWREYMEDRHFAMSSLPSDAWKGHTVFGVLDGHGGAQVAEFCNSRLTSAIAEGTPSDMSDALVNAFHKMDELLLSERSWSSTSAQVRGGCAAVVCVVSQSSISVAHAGDCRAVLCRSGTTVPLTEDHKPGLPRERKRILAAGGYLTTGSNGDLRVCADLNLSRAIGDLRFKSNSSLMPSEQIICSTPDVMSIPRTPQDEFIILACDGVWDVITNEDAVKFVRPRLHQCPAGNIQRMQSIMSELVHSCVSPNLSETAGLGGDNLTAMLINLQVNDDARAASREED
mmetsp:Transcript_6149/g.10668  ORF Transcript_6149/g.10668 Transcript_6149/m.10668 type:complete len:320 (+) Transcript_6149:85-1044(+)